MRGLAGAVLACFLVACAARGTVRVEVPHEVYPPPARPVLDAPGAISECMPGLVCFTPAAAAAVIGYIEGLERWIRTHRPLLQPAKP